LEIEVNLRTMIAMAKARPHTAPTNRTTTATIVDSLSNIKRTAAAVGAVGARSAMGSKPFASCSTSIGIVAAFAAAVVATSFAPSTCRRGLVVRELLLILQTLLLASLLTNLNHKASQPLLVRQLWLVELVISVVMVQALCTI